MQNKKVLIVTSEFPPQPGGIGDHAYNLSVQLSNHGHVVSVIGDQRNASDNQEVLFDSTLPFKVHRIQITSPRFLMYFNRIMILFKAIQSSDYVFASGKFSLWSVALASLFYKRKYIGVVHGTEVNFKGFMLRKSINLALKRFQSVVAVSNFTKKLISHLNLNVVVIPNGYNSEKWNSDVSETVELLGYPKLITIGNVTSRKGQQNVINLLPELIKRFPKIHYHCVGLMTEATKFIDLAAQLNVSSHVTFHGRIDDAKLHSMLLKCDIFVMLSSETKSGDVEGFGIAILEANALSIPSIGSKYCGIEDAINMGQSGVLIDPFSHVEFTEAIDSILEERSHFKIGAEQWAKQHEWNLIVVRYIDLLK